MLSLSEPIKLQQLFIGDDERQEQYAALAQRYEKCRDKLAQLGEIKKPKHVLEFVEDLTCKAGGGRSRSHASACSA